MKHKRSFLLLLLPLAAAAVIAVFLLQPKPYADSSFAMGSVVEQTVWGKKENGDLTARIADAIAALENEQLSARAQGSGLWRINAGEALRTEEYGELQDALLLALELARATGGAFSPALGPLIDLWRIDNPDGAAPRLPSQAEIDAALSLCDYNDIADSDFSLAAQGMKLSLGALGKGAACDSALRLLERDAVDGAVLSVGGNILTYGQKPFWQPFKIALRDPKGAAEESIGLFRLRGTNFISTSGSYEKYFEVDGKRYHHILDGTTGYPAETGGLIAVTILLKKQGWSPGADYARAQNMQPGAVADALSTACFLVGFEDALPLLEAYGCEALFIYEEGIVKATPGARACLELTNEAYHWA
ncbi:MAG: FAD:protein FMN transferase [Oscillospiraceae bacterium]|jgi:thiamine biosynthesis lipoprotein|nr:FAD:protein FMN transferase [Oscillospiraceae bacterium]